MADTDSIDSMSSTHSNRGRSTRHTDGMESLHRHLEDTESGNHQALDRNMNNFLQSNNELNSIKQTSDLNSVNFSSTYTPTVPTRRQKILRVTALLFAQFCVLSGYSIISPFFPQKAQDKGLTETQIGLIFSIFAVVTFVMAPIYGTLIIKLGPKFMCVAGCFLCGGSSILFGLLNYIEGRDVFLAMSLLVRVVEGNGSALLSVASASIVFESFQSSTGLMSSLLEMANALGYIGGPAFGSAFYAIGGYQLPFIIIGVMTLIMAAVLIFLLDNRGDTETQSYNFLRLLQIPGLVVIFLLMCVSSLSMTYLDPVLSDWMRETFRMSPATVGLLFVTWSATYAIVSPPLGKLVDKGYIYSIMIIGIIGSGVVYLFLAPSPLLDFMFQDHHYVWLVVIVCILEGLFGAAMYIPTYQAALHISEVNGYEQNVQTYGLVSGMMSSGTSLGSLAGPLASGYLTQKYTFKWATTVMTFTLLATAVMVLIYVITMTLMKKQLRPPKDEERSPLLTGTINSN